RRSNRLEGTIFIKVMNIKKISSLGLLAALCIIFTVISNYVQIGPVSINLSCIPIALAGMFFGPVYALLLGVINGSFILLAPSTIAFMDLSLGGTILTVLTKSAVAGFIGSFVFKLLKERHLNIAIVLCSALVPLLNTVFFILYSLAFFNEIFGSIISVFLAANFAIEFASCLVLVPTLYKIITSRQKIE
ncbi:MAG: ECF transporter S component, partial [Bacilli bacterium]|nr:ECF transporter S component [Bacilli bacterium]